MYIDSPSEARFLLGDRRFAFFESREKSDAVQGSIPRTVADHDAALNDGCLEILPELVDRQKKVPEMNLNGEFIPCQLGHGVKLGSREAKMDFSSRGHADAPVAKKTTI
jgi:hypothetical protein